MKFSRLCSFRKRSCSLPGDASHTPILQGNRLRLQALVTIWESNFARCPPQNWNPSAMGPEPSRVNIFLLRFLRSWLILNLLWLKSFLNVAAAASQTSYFLYFCFSFCFDFSKASSNLTLVTEKRLWIWSVLAAMGIEISWEVRKWRMLEQFFQELREFSSFKHSSRCAEKCAETMGQGGVRVDDGRAYWNWMVVMW